VTAARKFIIVRTAHRAMKKFPVSTWTQPLSETSSLALTVQSGRKRNSLLARSPAEAKDFSLASLSYQL
jgi:hypothetical protein